MSILTKISIVLLVVLVLPTSVVIVQQSSQLPSYMDAYERRGTAIESVNQNNRHLQLALRLAQEQGRSYAAAIQAVVAEKRTLQERLQAQITDLVAKELGMKGRLAGLDATYRALSESLKVEIASRKDLTIELNKFREKTNTFKDRIIQLNAALAEKEVAVTRLERTVQKFREQLVAREKEIAELIVRLAAQGRPATAATVGPPTGLKPDVPMIQGTITVIRDDVASINIGAAKGIKRGMKLIVFRDGHFVSYLRIDLVDLNSAAGVIVSKRLEPRATDKVRTR